MKKLKVSILFLFLIQSFTSAGVIVGKVREIYNGVNYTLDDGKSQSKVKLYGTAAPRSKSDKKKAAMFSRKLVLGKTVHVFIMHGNLNGHTYADLKLEDGRSISRELIKNGYAYWHPFSAKEDKELAKLEEKARKTKKGLWENPQATSPWRKEKMALLGIKIIDNPAPTGSDEQVAQKRRRKVKRTNPIAQKKVRSIKRKSSRNTSSGGVDGMLGNLTGNRDNVVASRLKGSVEYSISQVGKRGQASVNKTVKRHVAGLRHTYKKYLKKDSELKGEVLLKISLNNKGRVTKIQTLKSNTRTPRFDKELTRKIKRWRFDPFAGKSKDAVTLSLNFKR